MDTKGVEQPFKYNGKKDHEFPEWTQKLRVYLVAKYGGKIIKTLQWAARQRRIVVFTNDLGSDRMVSWRGVPEDEQIVGMEQMVTLTTGDAIKNVRNAGE